MSLWFKKLILVEFTGLTWGNKTIHDSSIQLNKTLPAHSTLHLWPQVKTFATTKGSKAFTQRGHMTFLLWIARIWSL